MLGYSFFFRKVQLSLIFVMCFHGIWANDRIDSLKQVISATTDDSTRLRFINEVATYYIFNDSEKALALLNQGLKEASEHGLIFCLNELTNTKGIYFDISGDKDSARHYVESALQLSREYNFRDIERMALNNLGLQYWSSGEFQRALNSFFQALEINRKYFSDDKESEANNQSNIGLIYQELKQYSRAIEYHQRALSIRDSLGLTNGKAISWANLGVCYYTLTNWEEAVSSYLKARDLALESGNLRMYYALHDNLGSVYIKKKEYDKAVVLLRKSLERPAHVGTYPKSDLSTYSNLVAAYVYQNNPREALNHAKAGFEIVNNNPELKNFAGTLYKHAAESYYMLGRMEEGRELLAEFVAIADSVFAENHAKALADLEVKFRTQEREAQLAQAEASLARHQLHIEKQNRMIYGSIAVILVIAAAGVLLYRQQKLKNLQLEKDKELADAQSQIAFQKKLNEQRLHISRELHDNIGTYLTLMKTGLERLPDSAESHRVSDVIKLMKKTAIELRHTVWILNNETTTLEEIILRIRDLLQFSTLEISASADVIGDDQLVLSNIQSTHLIRIVQEAVNNALKHGGATQIDILIYSNRDDVAFEIRDNGKGFDPDARDNGNGVRNMRYRLQKLDGEMEIESSPTAGTKVRGSFPLSDISLIPHSTT